MASNRPSNMEYTDRGEKETHHVHMCSAAPRTHKTAKQEFTIANTVRFGEALFIDGAIQSTVADEGLYHTPLVHGSAAFLARGPRNVLVIGGGEGCVARELLRYDTIECITQIDWDAELIDYFKSGAGRMWNGGTYDDARLKVVHEDVFETRALDGGTRYDLIIVDLCDPDEESIGLLKSLIVRLLACLEPDGVLIANGGIVLPSCVGGEESYARELMEYLEGLGGERNVFSYKVYVPSYMAPWCLIGLAGRNTIGDWSRRFISGSDVRAWMTYDRSYDEAFERVNDAFMRGRGLVAPFEWGC